MKVPIIQSGSTTIVNRGLIYCKFFEWAISIEGHEDNEEGVVSGTSHTHEPTRAVRNEENKQENLFLSA